MNDQDPDPNLDRLAEAIEAYIEHKATGDTSKHASTDELLDRHDHVRDLLEPMLASDANRSLPVGQRDKRLGNYRLLREIGRGGMGVVYEAVEESLGRRVALKVLPPHLTLSARQIERFRREASAAAKLLHENIVRIHAVGEENGTHFIAMEFRDGRNLRDILREVHERSGGDAQKVVAGGLASRGLGGYFEQVAALVASAAEALAYSHERGVIHRDIKPQNILVDDDGNVCVVDFGLAKDLDGATLSFTGDFAGTPDYISPEQAAAGRRPVDGRTDVFSLGVVMYEMLTLARPFSGDTTQHVLESVTLDDPRSVRASNPSVPRDLETICLKALEKDPHKRYTAAGFARDLRRFLRHEPIAARRVGPWGRALRFAKRRKAATVAGVFGFLLLVVTPIAASIYFKLARDAVVEEQRRTQQQRDLTRQSLQRARRALDNGLRRLEEFQLENHPGVHSFWRQLLVDSLAFYEQFVEVTATQAGMELEVARTRDRISTIQLNLGRHEAARESASAAIALYRALPPGDSDDPVVRVELALLLTNRAIAGIQAGHAVDLADLDEAIARFEAELAAKPRPEERPKLLRSLAMARFYKARGTPTQTPDRLALFDAAVAAWDAAERAAPGHPRFFGRKHLAESQRAYHLYSIGRRDEAFEGFDAARKGLATLVEKHPYFAALRDWHAETLRGLMWIHFGRGNHSEANALWNMGREEREWLVIRFPGRHKYENSLRHLEADRIELLCVRRDAVQLAAALKTALPAAEAAAAARPDVSESLRNLARILKAQAVLETWRTNRNSDAIVSFSERSIELWRRLVERQPADNVCRRELGGTLSNLANWYMMRKPSDPAKALALASEAIDHQKRAQDLMPGDAISKEYMVMHLKLVRNAGLSLGETEHVERAEAALRDLDPDGKSR